MGQKLNGSGKPPEEDKIVHFPTFAERQAEARRAAKAQSKPVPMINLSKIPLFTRTMVAVLLIVHVGLLLVDENARYQIFYMFGFVPAYFTGAVSGFPEVAWAGIITHMFIHAGLAHIAFNVITALTFGILFEREFGARRMAVLWFACGITGALLYMLLNPALTTPMIGASGSISGLFAAAILSLHDSKPRGGQAPVRSAWPLLIFWLVFMTMTGMLSGNNTAWQAHAGGFLCGTGLYYWFRTKSRGRI